MTSHSQNAADSDTTKGAAIYFSWFLSSLYDPVIMGVYCPLIWQCSAYNQLMPFYNRHITSTSQKLLDIGVGTGFYLQHAPFDKTWELTLMDLNQNCLDKAADRVRKHHPSTYCRTVLADALDPTSYTTDRLPERFDIISVMFFLHCLPRPVERKAAFLQGLGRILEPKNGVVFGSTVLGKDVPHNWLGKFIMMWHNWQGIFDNYEDDVKSFIDPLKQAFEHVEWSVVGTVLLFEARHPIKRDSS